MAEQSLQDKTEQATPKKKEDSRKKGQVAKSREISSIAVLITGTLYLYFNVKGMTIELGNNIKSSFMSIPEIIKENDIYLSLVSRTIQDFLILLMPLMITLCVVAILSNLLQTGPILSAETLTPKASKLNPIKGLGKMASKKSLVELAKSIFKILIVGWAAFTTIKEEFSQLLTLSFQENVQILSLMGQLSMKTVTRCCYVIFVLAILDFIYQKWEHEENLKMTKQEVKDEYKQMEGDPLVKSRIKSMQREMARRRMMEEVPEADAIITNPTHLSIALKYKTDVEMRAPTIVAKGANNIAFKIREIASKHNIPIIENKPLAQNLYKLDIGEEIPPQYYQAVAEILAYVYGLKKKEVNAQ